MLEIQVPDFDSVQLKLYYSLRKLPSYDSSLFSQLIKIRAFASSFVICYTPVG